MMNGPAGSNGQNNGPADAIIKSEMLDSLMEDIKTSGLLPDAILQAEGSQDAEQLAFASAVRAVGEQRVTGNGHTDAPDQPLLSGLPTFEPPDTTPSPTAREPIVVGGLPPIVPGMPPEQSAANAPNEVSVEPPPGREAPQAIETPTSEVPQSKSNEKTGVPPSETSVGATPSTPESPVAQPQSSSEATTAAQSASGVPAVAQSPGPASDTGQPTSIRLASPLFWGVLSVALVAVIIVAVGSAALAKQLAPKPQVCTSDLYHFAITMQESVQQQEGGGNCRGRKFLLLDKTANGEKSLPGWLRICDLTLDQPLKASDALTGHLSQRLEAVIGPQWSKQQITPFDELEVGVKRRPGVGMHLLLPGGAAVTQSTYWYEIITQNGKRLYAIEVSCTTTAWDSCWGTFGKMIDSLEFQGNGMRGS